MSVCLMTARGLGFRHADGRVVFDGVELSLHEKKCGLVGINGSGKSTLLSLLAGRLVPTAGEIKQAGRVAYLPQNAALESLAAGMSVAELLGVARPLAALRRIEAGEVDQALFDAVGDDWGIEERAAGWLGRVGLAATMLGRPLASLSGGERTRAQVAALLRDDPKVLLLDEPTNHLDRDARRELSKLLLGFPGGVLIASHDRELLGAMDEIWEMSEAGLRVYGGNYESYVEQRAVIDAAAAARVQAAKQELGRVKEAAIETRERQQRRMAQAKKSTPKQGLPQILLGMRKRQGETTTARLGDVHAQRTAAAAVELTEAKSQLRQVDELKIDVPETKIAASKRVLELEGVNAPLPMGGELWSEAIDVLLVGPRRVALTGPNGIGKSTLLRLIAGGRNAGMPAYSGTIVCHIERLAYLDQNLGGYDPQRSLVDLVRDAAPRMSETDRRIRLGRFLFEGEDAVRPLGELSGGERMRAALALALVRDEPPQLLLLDEPSNHLDITSVRHMEQALAAYQGAMIVASHDQVFLEALGCDVTWELTPAGIRKT